MSSSYVHEIFLMWMWMCMCVRLVLPNKLLPPETLELLLEGGRLLVHLGFRLLLFSHGCECYRHKRHWSDSFHFHPESGAVELVHLLPVFNLTIEHETSVFYHCKHLSRRRAKVGAYEWPGKNWARRARDNSATAEDRAVDDSIHCV